MKKKLYYGILFTQVVSKETRRAYIYSAEWWRALFASEDDKKIILTKIKRGTKKTKRGKKCVGARQQCTIIASFAVMCTYIILYVGYHILGMYMVYTILYTGIYIYIYIVIEVYSGWLSR